MVLESTTAVVLVSKSGAHPSLSILDLAMKERTIGQRDAVLGISQYLQASLGKFREVLVTSGGDKDIV